MIRQGVCHRPPGGLRSHDFFGRGTADLKSPASLPLDIAMPDMLRGGPCRGDLFASFSPDDSKVGKSFCAWWVDLSFFSAIHGLF